MLPTEHILMENGNHERKKLSDGDVLKIAAISFKVEIS